MLSKLMEELLRNWYMAEVETVIINSSMCFKWLLISSVLLLCAQKWLQDWHNRIQLGLVLFLLVFAVFSEGAEQFCQPYRNRDYVCNSSAHEASLKNNSVMLSICWGKSKRPRCKAGTHLHKCHCRCSSSCHFWSVLLQLCSTLSACRCPQRAEFSAAPLLPVRSLPSACFAQGWPRDPSCSSHGLPSRAFPSLLPLVALHSSFPSPVLHQLAYSGMGSNESWIFRPSSSLSSSETS